MGGIGRLGCKGRRVQGRAIGDTRRVIEKPKSSIVKTRSKSTDEVQMNTSGVNERICEPYACLENAA